ncbi:ribbon-helix-helix protein, CopG family [Bradyrhizobium sp. HKCCYLS1011]|uniref:ribbon-helix-helix protein, CopG family n=1 Tax=Bradyrhizobium sp. HKCCYLS1011 TaxID=3420733 RepID=UPI003EB6D8C8
MSKAPKYPARIDSWMSAEMAVMVEALAEAEQLTSSAVIRRALAHYFATLGIAQPRAPRPQHHREVINGQL